MKSDQEKVRTEDSNPTQSINKVGSYTWLGYIVNSWSCENNASQIVNNNHQNWIAI